MQVSPSSLDRIFYGWIFWKAYGWNCAQKLFFFKKISQNFFSTSQSVTLFVKIRDFSQIVLWRLHFPVERSAISFFYKPWVIFRHRKKNQKFPNIFSHFFSSSKFSFFRNFQINPFWKFRKFIWRFSKKYSLFQKKTTYFLLASAQLLFRVPLGFWNFSL